MKYILFFFAGIVGLFVAVAIIFVLYLWIADRVNHTRTVLLNTEHQGLKIHLYRDFTKSNGLGGDREKFVLLLNDEPAVETGRHDFGSQPAADIDALPLPVHPEDKALIEVLQFGPGSLPDSIRCRNYWIRPQKFSKSDFERLADFIRENQGAPVNPFGSCTPDFPYFIRNLVYGDPKSMNTRMYRRIGPGDFHHIIEVRMDGTLEMQQSSDGGKNYFSSAGLGKLSDQADTLFFHWNLGGYYAGGESFRLDIKDLPEFRDDQGQSLTERYPNVVERNDSLFLKNN